MAMRAHSAWQHILLAVSHCHMRSLTSRDVRDWGRTESFGSLVYLDSLIPVAECPESH